MYYVNNQLVIMHEQLYQGARRAACKCRRWRKPSGKHEKACGLVENASFARKLADAFVILEATRWKIAKQSTDRIGEADKGMNALASDPQS